MKRTYLLAVLASVLLTSAAYAEMDGMRKASVTTRQDAIARTKEHLAKLEAMSDKEWSEKHAERMKRFEARRAARMQGKDAGKLAPAAAAPAAK